MSIRWSRSPWVASLLIAILASPNEDPLHAQAPATTPAATKTSAPAPVTPPPGTNADTGWPRTLQMQNGTLVWFQPQVESWTDRKKIVAWSAVAYTPLTATQAALGTIKIEGDTQVSVDEDVVSLDMKVTQYNFPTLSSVQVRAMVSEVETLPVRQRVLDLDRLLAYVSDSPLQAKSVEGLKVDPPTIYQATGTRDSVESGRRAHLEPDQGSRSPVCCEHELGSVRIWPYEDVVPEARKVLDAGDQNRGAMGDRQEAAGQLQETAG